MITKINVKIYGRQFVDNGKYIIARAPNWKDVDTCKSCVKLS
ncbi:MAG: hypothetical protein ACM3WQ_07050 [Chloroflexota bacterium]